MMGTASIIPTIPQIIPQKARDIITITGDRLVPFPMIMGWIKLPIITCIASNAIKTYTKRIRSPEVITAKMAGKREENNGPRYGMKFRINIY